MSLVRCLSLRSVRNARRYRSTSSCLIPLQTHREEENDTRQTPPASQRYHSFLHLNSSNVGSGFSPFKSLMIPSHRSISTGPSFETVTDWVFQSAVSNAYVLHNVADTLASIQHLIALLNTFTFGQWWVCIIVTSLLIRGITIPVMIDLLNRIAKILGSEGIDKKGSSGLSKRMYTVLQKEFVGVKGSIIGEGIQVPVVWFSMAELKQNLGEILMSSLRGKTFSAELMRNRVLNRGRLVVVVGDGFGLEIQMLNFDFSRILLLCPNLKSPTAPLLTISHDKTTVVVSISRDRNIFIVSN